jgi:hypothetical protein
MQFEINGMTLKYETNPFFFQILTNLNENFRKRKPRSGGAEFRTPDERSSLTTTIYRVRNKSLVALI